MAAMHRDTTGEIWGQWLASALLSGLMKQEQMGCPTHMLQVILGKVGAVGTSQLTLSRATTIAQACAAVDVTQGCRIAVSIVVSVSVYGVACSQVCTQRALIPKLSESAIWGFRCIHTAITVFESAIHS